MSQTENVEAGDLATSIAAISAITIAKVAAEEPDTEKARLVMAACTSLSRVRAKARTRARARARAKASDRARARTRA